MSFIPQCKIVLDRKRHHVLCPIDTTTCYLSVFSISLTTTPLLPIHYNALTHSHSFLSLSFRLNAPCLALLQCCSPCALSMPFFRLLVRLPSVILPYFPSFLFCVSMYIPSISNSVVTPCLSLSVFELIDLNSTSRW